MTPEQVHQQLGEIEKTGSLPGSFGICHMFRSVFNNIVNARFGNQSGGGTTIITSD
jgi:hypothetical protein